MSLQLKQITKSLVLSLQLFSASTMACSSALLNIANEPVAVKSYDFHNGDGRLFFYPAGLTKTTFHPLNQKKPVQWTSKYKNLSFSQIGANLSFGGMNEAGLWMEILWDNGAQYAPPSGKSNVLNESHVIQYVLDQAATVDEAVALIKGVDLIPIIAKVHYFICDKDKNCAAVEGQKGKLVVTPARNLKALANDTYEVAVDDYKNGITNSRFGILATASSQAQYSGNAFDLLSAVSQENFTRWQIVYNLKTKTIKWRTVNRPEVKEIHLDELSSACQTQNLSWDIDVLSSGAPLTLGQAQPWTMDMATYYLSKFALSGTVPDELQKGVLAQQFIGLSCVK